jgi:hypothetical protein
VHGLRHFYPTEQAAHVRRDLLPVLSEVNGAAMQLSMAGDEKLQSACQVVANAAYELVGAAAVSELEHQRLQDAVSDALGELRSARDLAALSRWHWRKRRRLRRHIDQVRGRAITGSSSG